MNPINPLSGSGKTPNANSRQTRPQSPTTASTTDSVEFSDQGLALAESLDSSKVRLRRIAETRRAITEGVYSTDDKLEFVAGRIEAELSLPEPPSPASTTPRPPVVGQHRKE